MEVVAELRVVLRAGLEAAVLDMAEELVLAQLGKVIQEEILQQFTQGLAAEVQVLLVRLALDQAVVMQVLVALAG